MRRRPYSQYVNEPSSDWADDVRLLEQMYERTEPPKPEPAGPKWLEHGWAKVLVVTGLMGYLWLIFWAAGRAMDIAAKHGH